MNVLSALVQSRKFWLAVMGLVSVILMAFGFPELADERVNMIVETLTWLFGALIAGIALEDAASKRSSN